MHNVIKAIIIILLVCIILFSTYIFFMSKKVSAQNITWGVAFSQMQAEALKLDWKKTYLAILEDLGAKHIKLHTQWDWVEGKKDDYFFNDIDWQVREAQKHGTSMIYVTGMKTGRWPECHMPSWTADLSKKEQQEEILEYITQVVQRYKKSKAIVAWQAENEPLFKFGKCPWYDKDFLKKEVELIKLLDPARPVIISDSGEQSVWLGAAKIGDIVGTTLYRKVWVHLTDRFGFYFDFKIPAVSYGIRAKIIKQLFNKEVINVELQAEPWVSDVYINTPLEEQEKSMNLEQFKKNVEYAKATGLNKFYFWGAEWWYWMKTQQSKPEIWNEAKKLF